MNTMSNSQAFFTVFCVKEFHVTGGSTENNTKCYLPFLCALLGMVTGICEPVQDSETSFFLCVNERF